MHYFFSHVFQSYAGYTVRRIQPAKNADVISLARAMNPDMGPRVQKLFEVEKQAAMEAQESGIFLNTYYL